MAHTIRSVMAKLRMKHSLDLRLCPSNVAQIKRLPAMPTKLMTLKHVSLTAMRESAVAFDWSITEEALLVLFSIVDGVFEFCVRQVLTQLNSFKGI